MRTIRELLKTDNRENGYEILNDNTIVIYNSRSYMLWPETEQFLGIIDMNWNRGDIVKSVEHEDIPQESGWHDACIIKFNISLDEEIEVKEAI